MSIVYLLFIIGGIFTCGNGNKKTRVNNGKKFFSITTKYVSNQYRYGLIVNPINDDITLWTNIGAEIPELYWYLNSIHDVNNTRYFLIINAATEKALSIDENDELILNDNINDLVDTSFWYFDTYQLNKDNINPDYYKIKNKYNNKLLTANIVNNNHDLAYISNDVNTDLQIWYFTTLKTRKMRFNSIYFSPFAVLFCVYLFFIIKKNRRRNVNINESNIDINNDININIPVSIPQINNDDNISEGNDNPPNYSHINSIESDNTQENISNNNNEFIR